MIENKNGFKVLIVDDEAVVRETLGKILRDEGFNVFVADDGVSAIRIAEKELIDAALLDIRLPDINGVDVFEKIKTLRPKLKVVLMTGYEVEELVGRAFRLGAFACLHKPFEIDNILKIFSGMKEENERKP